MAHKLNEKTYPPEALSRIWQLITDAKCITLLTHYRPDGDGISACAAFESVLHELGKKNVETVYPTETEFTLTRHPKVRHIATHTQTPDVLVAFDTANPERLYLPEEFAGIPLINIDHHVSNRIDGVVNIVDAQASSACEVLYNLLEAYKSELITPYVAECLLFGIICDSQVFHTQNTQAATLRAGANLMDRGANLFALKTELLSNKNPQIIALWGHLLQTITLSKNGKAAWALLRQADLAPFGLELNSLVGFINFLAEISGVDATAIFVEVGPKETKVSLRSKQADVNAIAGQFGGGGHKNASGIRILEPFDEVVAKVTAALERIQ